MKRFPEFAHYCCERGKQLMAKFISLGGGVLLVVSKGKFKILPPCDPEQQLAIDAATLMLNEAQNFRGAPRKRLEAAAVQMLDSQAAAIEQHIDANSRV
jgi:hypothetical protein